MRALAGYFGLSVPEKRRCRDHVIATAFIWGNLVERLEKQHGGVGTQKELSNWLAETNAPARGGRVYPMDPERKRGLPDAPGIYRMLRSNGDVLYIGVDAGMNTLIRPALYGSYHDITNLSRRTGRTERVHVVGPICETADVLGHDRWLPTTEPGDVLLIENAGAYGAVMSSRYNLRPPAEELILE